MFIYRLELIPQPPSISHLQINAPNFFLLSISAPLVQSQALASVHDGLGIGADEMPTARMFRAAAILRLNHCIRIAPSLRPRLQQFSPWAGASQLHSSALLRTANHGFEAYGWAGSADLDKPPSLPPHRTGVAAEETENFEVDSDDVQNRSRFTEMPSQKERREQFKNGNGSSRSRCRLSSLREASRSTSGRRRRPFVYRSPTYITWDRVHETYHQSRRRANRFANDASTDDIQREPRDLVMRLRAMHLQWGWLRHQKSTPDEVLASRRLFSSWKFKIYAILKVRNHYPFAWAENGRWLFELDSVPEMRQAWEEMDVDSRRKQWPFVMLSTLYSSPGKARHVLEATLDPLPPGYAILDVLVFIARSLQLDRIKNYRKRTIKAEETFDLVAKLLECLPEGHMPFGQRAFGLLARNLPSVYVNDLYAILQRSKHVLHPNTQLQFASKLASHMSYKETAFGILKGLMEKGVSLNGPSPQSVVTTLLHCRADHEGSSDQTATFSPRRALEDLMEGGFTPNHINATAFLDSLCQQSEVEESIRLALLFSESGIALDARTWATIFRGAKHSLKIENIVKSFDVAKASNAPYVDVLNNSLHAIYYFADVESRQNVRRAPWILPLFEPMLHLYAQKFELERLQWWLPDSLPLIITRPGGYSEKFESCSRAPWRFLRTIVTVVRDFFAAGTGTPRIAPNTTTVATMLRAYIRTLRQPHDILSFYAFFKSRLEDHAAPDSFASDFVREQGSLIHDTLIMTLLERKGTSRPALHIFGDMLRDHLQRTPLKPHNPTPSAPLVLPAPTLCTFSILLRGLFYQGDHPLAAQILQIMREQGIEPNLVAHNTLVKGYALIQSIGKTVGALQDIEAAGFKPDVFTFKAFARLRDQAKALDRMERIIERNRQQMMGDGGDRGWM